MCKVVYNRADHATWCLVGAEGLNIRAKVVPNHQATWAKKSNRFIRVACDDIWKMAAVDENCIKKGRAELRNV